MSTSALLGLALPGLTLLAVLALGWRVLRREAAAAREHDALVRLEARLDVQARHADERARATEELVRALNGHLRAAAAETREALERRVGEMRHDQSESAGRQRTELVERFDALQAEVRGALAGGHGETVGALAELREQVSGALARHETRFERRQLEALRSLGRFLQSGMVRIQGQVGDALARQTEALGTRVEALTGSTDQRLAEISAQVEQRLADGFEKTTATFHDVLKRLALIDEAQKKITELSGNVVSLQEVLADKRSRGAFGEVQLAALVRNVLPESAFALQHTLAGGQRADCVLFLPEPTGNVVIDAKFPLESFKRLSDPALAEAERRAAERQLKVDVRRHIADIAAKYIVPGETSDGAVMFIPAEAVFAEIQAHHPDLVDTAHAARVWLCSPTTLMAVLNTARAVLKDAATRKQVHIIQEHLGALAQDFGRFRTRMDRLAAHIRQAHEDVDRVHVSAQKISERFERIERVEIEEEPGAALDTPASRQERP